MNHKQLRAFRPENVRYPMLMSDYCLRCCRLFATSEGVLNIVATDGGDRQVTLQVCADCFRGGDSAVAISVYVRRGYATDPDSMRPRLTGAPLDGFLHLKLLDNGFWRVGLKRGHAEIWTNREVGSHLARTAVRAYKPMGYNHDYSLYGSMEVIGKVAGAHVVIREDFLDLRTPAAFSLEGTSPRR